MAGGFCNDEHVYVFDTNEDGYEKVWERILPTVEECWRHPELQRQQQQQGGGGGPPNHVPINPLIDGQEQSPSAVYGATLTPLDDRRALRFGGFRGGGYTGECAEVALLTIQTRDIDRGDHEEDDDDDDDNTVKASWQVIQTHNAGMSFALARAYHTATLIANRYLLVLGGMMATGCIRGEAILDTETWTWLTDTPITQAMRHPKPSGRHGHSTILDEKRNRMVLFGGGSGNDLLRSGSDNAEVWELCMVSTNKQAIL
jgi:hypothetical protein